MGGRTYGLQNLLLDGNVYATVFKLDGSTGAELWRYQESAQSLSTDESSEHFTSDDVEGVAVDAEDNVFLVGQTYRSIPSTEEHPEDSDAFAMKVSMRVAHSTYWMKVRLGVFLVPGNHRKKRKR